MKGSFFGGSERGSATTQLIAIVAGTVLASSSLAPAFAHHKHVEGGFTATAPPAPDCSIGFNEASEPFVTPFGGFLFLEMNDFVGDWDLFLRDSEGVKVKASTNSNDPVFGHPGEKISLWLPGGREFSMVACNYSGGRTAEVTYSFTHLGPPKSVAPPKKRTERSWVGSYSGPGAGTAMTGSQFCHVGYEVGCSATDAYWGFDRFVSATVTDATGLPVAAAVYQYAGDDPGPSYIFCGSTEEPVRLMPDADWVGVELLVGPCLDGTPAAATTGEVQLTFSSHP